MSNEQPKEQAAAKPPKKVSVKLKQPIVQGTTAHEAGATVELTEAQAKRLREQGVVE